MRVLVTGAGGSIGSAAVRAFLNQGDEVLGFDISEAALEKTEGLSERIAGDLLCDSDLDILIKRLGGELDSVVVAHGIDGSASLRNIEKDFCEKVLKINLLSVQKLFAATLPLLKKNNGSFVVVVSQAGIRAEPDNVAYNASKYALNGWIATLAKKAEQVGVHVRSNCPGCIGTPLYYAAQTRYAEANGVSLEEFLEYRNSKIPLGRIANVEEIGASLAFMADPKNPRPVIMAPTGGETLL